MKEIHILFRIRLTYCFFSFLVWFGLQPDFLNNIIDTTPPSILLLLMMIMIMIVGVTYIIIIGHIHTTTTTNTVYIPYTAETKKPEKISKHLYRIHIT